MLAPNKAAARHLRACARYIKNYGLLRGGMGFDGGPRCMLGAVSSICSRDAASEASQNARKFLYLITGAGAVADYSDSVEAPDAIAAFNIAADIAEVGWDE